MVNHAPGEYARGDVTTHTVEGFLEFPRWAFVVCTSMLALST